MNIAYHIEKKQPYVFPASVSSAPISEPQEQLPMQALSFYMMQTQKKTYERRDRVHKTNALDEMLSTNANKSI